MTKRKRLTKEQESLKQRILAAYRRPYGFSYVPPSWDTKLWKKSTSDIHEFLENRFRETLDVVEYYSAMVLLWKTMPNTELLVEFHLSPQWMKVADTYNHTGENETLSRSKQNRTESSVQSVETVKPVDTIHVIGDD